MRTYHFLVSYNVVMSVLRRSPPQVADIGMPPDIGGVGDPKYLGMTKTNRKRLSSEKRLLTASVRLSTALGTADTVSRKERETT